MCKIEIKVNLPETIVIPKLNCGRYENGIPEGVLENVKVKTNTLRLTNFQYNVPYFSSGEYHNYSFGFLKQDKKNGIEINFQIDENENLIIENAMTWSKPTEVLSMIRKEKIQAALGKK
jgi:hypothetical protein